ncbi:MAG TPA: sugar ABC transporter permease [Sphaerochaeta sp.]|nr:sugar ABC transporter permease [Sphaerochaeta sp.]
MLKHTSGNNGETTATTHGVGRLDRNFHGILFVLPVVLVLVLLVVYPLCYGVYISFFKTNLVSKWDFVGLKYYVQALTNSDFLIYLANSFRFTLYVVSFHLIIGVLLSILLNRDFKGKTCFRIILLLPWLFPESVIALLFKWMLNPIYGVFNAFLTQVGIISQPMSWLGNSQFAMTAVITVCIWKGYPMVMMMILAGLQSIPKDYYEAARIDGAGGLQSLRYITIPSLKHVLVITLLLDTIWWFKHYTLVWILTGGGPGNDTSLVSIGIYKEAFEFFEFGKAAAMSVVVFLICNIIGFLYQRMLDRE